MKKQNKQKQNHYIDKRIVAIYIIVIFSLIIGITYALNQNAIPINASSSSFKIAYESTFDTSNLQFSPILDNNLETNENNVIKINFEVGGVDTNPNVDTIYDIALVDLTMDKELKSEYIKWKLFLSNQVLAEGDFSDIKDKDRLVLTGTQQDLPPSTDPKDKYTFYLWFSDSCQESNLINCKNAEDQSYMLNKKISGKLEVELNTGNKTNKNILIHFNPNGGEVDISSKTVIYNSTYNSLPIPKRNGYTFIGWFDSKYKNNPLYYYADTYPEVLEQYGFNEKELYNHYLKIGNKEGKRISQFSKEDKVNITTDTTLYAGWIANNEIYQ